MLPSHYCLGWNLASGDTSQLENSGTFHIKHSRDSFSLVIDLLGTPWSSFKESNQVIQQFLLQKDQPWLLNNGVMMTRWPCFGLNRHGGCWNLNRVWRERNSCSFLAMADFLLGGFMVDKPLCWVTLKHVQLHLLLYSLVAFHLFANLKTIKNATDFM